MTILHIKFRFQIINILDEIDQLAVLKFFKTQEYIMPLILKGWIKVTHDRMEFLSTFWVEKCMFENSRVKLVSYS